MRLTSIKPPREFFSRFGAHICGFTWHCKWDFTVRRKNRDDCHLLVTRGTVDGDVCLAVHLPGGTMEKQTRDPFPFLFHACVPFLSAILFDSGDSFSSHYRCVSVSSFSCTFYACDRGCILLLLIERLSPSAPFQPVPLSPVTGVCVTFLYFPYVRMWLYHVCSY